MKQHLNKHIVTIVGNVCTGKTTSLPLVAKALHADTIKADEIFQTSLFRDEFLQDVSRWAFIHEIWLAKKRADFIAKEIEKSKNQTIVIDSGLIMSYVYAKSHFLVGKMTLKEWSFFEELFLELHHVSPQTTLLYLSAPIDTLIGRMKKRGRDYEIKKYKKEYLEELEIGLRDLVASSRHIFKNLIAFDTNQIGNITTHEKDKRKFIDLVKKRLEDS